ncbi:MAG: hypothetical protein U0X93_02670 [Anaerolineales bacterium]
MNEFKHFRAQAIIFDKDGTLIDFDAMWGGWTLHLAEQLHLVSGIHVRDALCDAFGYDQAAKKVLAHGMMAASPMGKLYQLTVEVIGRRDYPLNRRNESWKKVGASPTL